MPHTPQLIAILQLGSAISGECSACHEVVIVGGVGSETQEELVHLLRHAFVKHVSNEHPPES